MHTIIKPKRCWVALLSFLGLATASFAEQTGSHTHSAMQHRSSTVSATPASKTMHTQHGAAIYRASSIESKWLLDNDGQGELQSELKSWIGSDYHKLFIKAHHNKVESASSHYDVAAYYSRYLAEFWDLQLGVRYRNALQHDQDDTAAVIGLHGLAPYFFETELELAVSDQQSSLALEASRDILLSQKWIAEPYVEATLIMHDTQTVEKRRGLSELQLGLQARYQINQRFIPFLDLSYVYDKGDAHQSSSDGIRYGLGLMLKF